MESIEYIKNESGDLMGEWIELVQETQSRWNENAGHWDDYMGEESNRWHRELIRPYTEKSLSIPR